MHFLWGVDLGVLWDMYMEAAVWGVRGRPDSWNRTDSSCTRPGLSLKGTPLAYHWGLPSSPWPLCFPQVLIAVGTFWHPQ